MPSIALSRADVVETKGSLDGTTAIYLTIAKRRRYRITLPLEVSDSWHECTRLALCWLGNGERLPQSVGEFNASLSPCYLPTLSGKCRTRWHGRPHPIGSVCETKRNETKGTSSHMNERGDLIPKSWFCIENSARSPLQRRPRPSEIVPLVGQGCVKKGRPREAHCFCQSRRAPPVHVASTEGSIACLAFIKIVRCLATGCLSCFSSETARLSIFPLLPGLTTAALRWRMRCCTRVAVVATRGRDLKPGVTAHGRHRVSQERTSLELLPPRWQGSRAQRQFSASSSAGGGKTAGTSRASTAITDRRIEPTERGRPMK